MTAAIDQGETSRCGVVALILASLGFAAATALLFLVRAGDAGQSNWPVTWELRSSDNGVLFQVMQDLFAGRELDWSFSPQVYVFPEIPLSFLAYVIAAGNIYAYYLVVAVLHNTVLFLAIYGVIGLVFPQESRSERVLRSLVASLPLLLFPLIGTAWLLSYPLAPTYYFGLYLLVFGAPALLLVRARWVRVLLVVGVALLAASNPLALVFTLPGCAAALLLRVIRSGVRSALRPLALVGGTLVLALLLRLIFGPLEGGSPLAYIDRDIFAGRLSALEPYFRWLAQDPATRTILLLGAGLAIVCLCGAVVAAIRLWRTSAEESDRLLAWVYFGLVPLGGLAGTAILMITHYLYFWPVLIAPFIVVLMALPRRWPGRLFPAAVLGFVLTLVFTGFPQNLAQLDRYFGYRSAETTCLDEGLPADVSVGYSTFSDARRISLTSQRPFRLFQLKSDGSPAYWLTNRSYLREQPGEFFYLNEHGDEAAIDRGFIESNFGAPDSEFSCGDGQTVLLYRSAEKLAAIADHFGVPR